MSLLSWSLISSWESIGRRGRVKPCFPEQFLTAGKSQRSTLRTYSSSLYRARAWPVKSVVFLSRPNLSKTSFMVVLGSQPGGSNRFTWMWSVYLMNELLQSMKIASTVCTVLYYSYMYNACYCSIAITTVFSSVIIYYGVWRQLHVGAH